MNMSQMLESGRSFQAGGHNQQGKCHRDIEKGKVWPERCPLYL